MFSASGLYYLSEWIIRLVMLVYVPQRRSAAASRTWLLLIFLLPWPGLLVYALFGRIYVSAGRIQQQRRVSAMIRSAQAQMPQLERWDGRDISPRTERVSRLTYQLADFEAVSGNKVDLIVNYSEIIERLVADIDASRTHVHLLYYIYEDDETGRRVAEALIRAVKRGVDCRLMMDAVGSRTALSGLAMKLRTQGVKVQALLPVGLFRRNAERFDLRNHRKIAVVDSLIGYTGSQNIANPEFIKGYPNEELVARVCGPIVQQLQAAFLSDWYFETGNVTGEGTHFKETKPSGDSPAQLMLSGPGYFYENVQKLMIALLYSARERVVIATPYFVPDESFLQAMETAVQQGVTVDLVLSAKSNQRVTNLAQRSYYEQLLDAGVRIHLFIPRFLHAKHMSVDDEIALIGSTNIDIRSFALNAELCMLIYDPKVIATLRDIQDRYIAESQLVIAEKWRNRPWLAKVTQNIARLADSLL
ncbi:MAG TPA: cardiolipin synthase [Methylococcaceae bacterium]|jgi:cardiolipin synthase|nr:cardiolipin synthase [Methylococcaceae bacterium]